MTHYTITSKSLSAEVRSVSIVDSTGRVIASAPVVLTGLTSERDEVLSAALALAHTAGLMAF